MWDMLSNTLKLFFKGKLFREPAAVFRQWLIGFAVAAIGVVLLVKVGVSLWPAIAVTALLSGGLQPLLFKNLKYS